MVRRKLHVRAGDKVQVIAGKDKGKQGKVVSVLVKDERVVIEGVNTAKRHSKPTQKNPQGGIVLQDLPIHVSNVMILDPQSGKPTRIGKKLVEGKKGEKSHYVRIAKASGALLDQEVKK